MTNRFIFHAFKQFCSEFFLSDIFSSHWVSVKVFTTLTKDLFKGQDPFNWINTQATKTTFTQNLRNTYKSTVKKIPAKWKTGNSIYNAFFVLPNFITIENGIRLNQRL